MDRLIAKQTTRLLTARDRRHEALVAVQRQAAPATLFVSLNIPGPEKSPPGAVALYSWMLGELSRRFSGWALRVDACDALGPYAIASLPINPIVAKKQCIGLEESLPATRLLDLDVYSDAGRQIDRAGLGLPGRPCLLCARPAVECIRVKRHPYAELIGQAHALLADFCA